MHFSNFAMLGKPTYNVSVTFNHQVAALHMINCRSCERGSRSPRVNSASEIIRSNGIYTHLYLLSFARVGHNFGINGFII